MNKDDNDKNASFLVKKATGAHMLPVVTLWKSKNKPTDVRYLALMGEKTTFAQKGKLDGN
jgi:hypothetical protein